jgi:hypothetical protein
MRRRGVRSVRLSWLVRRGVDAMVFMEGVSVCVRFLGVAKRGFRGSLRLWDEMVGCESSAQPHGR